MIHPEIQSTELDSIIKKPHTLISHHFATQTANNRGALSETEKIARRAPDLLKYTSVNLLDIKMFPSFCFPFLFNLSCFQLEAVCHLSAASDFAARSLYHYRLQSAVGNASNFRNSNSASHADCLIIVCEPRLKYGPWGGSLSS